MKTSKLTALGPKTDFISNNANILNPSLGSGISTTPSPIGTHNSPLSLTSLSDFNDLPSMSPAPSPINKSPIVNDIRQSLADIKALPPINGSLEPNLSGLSNLSNIGSSSPSAGDILMSSMDLGELPESPLAKSQLLLPESPLEKSYVNLGSNLGGSGFSGLEINSDYLDDSLLPESPLAKSLVNLKSSPSLDNLQGFKSFSEFNSPISLPPISATKSLSNALDEDLKPLDNSRTVIDEDAESSLSFHNMDGLLDENDVEQTLMNSGYVPVDKIFTKDENDNLMCQYIKAVDATGRTSFVDLDEEGYVTADKNEIAMTKESKASIVPYSVKMGTYECASSDVCGVAFECDNEVCTMKRTDDSLEPKESVFTYSKSPNSSLMNKSHGMLDSNPIAYPIISLSKIKNYPMEASKSIRESHDRMRNVAFNQCNKEANSLIASVKDLNSELNRYKKNQRSIALTLTKTIKQLETIHSAFQRKPPTTEVQKENLRLVHFNLRKRHDFVIELLKSCEKVNAKRDKIRELKNEIKETNDFNDSLFEGLDGVFTE